MSGRTIARAAAVAAAFAAMTIAAYSQAAAGAVIPTRLSIYALQARAQPYHLAASGQLHAPKHRCIANRKVRLYFNRADKRHLRDTDWSSHHGAVALKGRWHGEPRRVIVKVPRRRVDRNRHPYTCGSDRVAYSFGR